MAADDQKIIDEKYPLLNYRFMAKVGDDEIFFSEISGLSMEYETSEYKEATKDGVKTTQLIGQRNVPSVTLKRGLFLNGLNLYKWFNSTHTPDFKKKDITITMLNDANEAVLIWTVSNAFGTKFEGPGLDATSNDVAFQTLELKGDLLEVKDP